MSIPTRTPEAIEAEIDRVEIAESDLRVKRDRLAIRLLSLGAELEAAYIAARPEFPTPAHVEDIQQVLVDMERGVRVRPRPRAWVATHNASLEVVIAVHGPESLTGGGPLWRFTGKEIARMKALVSETLTVVDTQRFSDGVAFEIAPTIADDTEHTESEH